MQPFDMHTCADQGISVDELANASRISLYVAKEQLEVPSPLKYHITVR
jgi:hypothetical protein